MDPTQAQGSEELRRARDLSLRRGRPPCDVPGYEPRKFLGAGAYGEVWVAIDRNTGRQVAIKFYLHRGGLDWSLLAHEVEKLAFLSADRYVVQLLDVGWDSEPPYYVMEYIEHGSLEDALKKSGPMPVAQATELFREIAIGLNHAHGKGVLHCDLKPANILLDQDGHPRLADFGQSRLSHEQKPALGTLFYMAPEQADMKASPDARWDVYALGALFYTLLTGSPPHRHDVAASQIEQAPDLEDRLARYRRLLAQAPPPQGHREKQGVDKLLADIIDRALAVDPRQRFPNVQAVLDALEARTQHRARRPLVVLGALGPILLLAVLSLLGWLWFNTSLRHSSDALTERGLQGLGFAAQSVAASAGKELEMRFRDVEEIAADAQLIEALGNLEDDGELRSVLQKLSDPAEAQLNFDQLRRQYRAAPEAQALQERLAKLVSAKSMEEVASWFIDDARGLQLARVPASDTIGRNFAWRSYFHGGAVDQPIGWRPSADEHVRATQLSAIYRSRSSGRWVVSISTPIYREVGTGGREFLGIVAMSFEVGRKFIEMPEGSAQFAVLIDARDGARPGTILQHPLFDKYLERDEPLPERFEKYTVPAVALPTNGGDANYRDVLGRDEDGAEYREQFLAAPASIPVRDEATGWVILVQDSYDRAIGGTLTQLRRGFVMTGLAALLLATVVIVGLWWFVIRMLEKPARWQPPATTAMNPTTAETLPVRV